MTREQFLAQHPAFARVYRTGDGYLIRAFLRDHPAINRAWQNLGRAPAGGAAPAGAATPAPPSPAPPGYNRNWYQTMVGIFEGYGLGALAPAILSYAQQGVDDQDTLEVLLRQTPEFKKRFAANEKRVAAGLNALSISTYLNLENEYASILRGSGLPSGFYDSNDDFTNWIANDVSADEVRTRVSMAQQAVGSSDPSIRRALSDYYGLGDGDLVAYFLDQNRATSLFETRRRFAAANVGAAANQQGLGVDRARAEFFADQGVTAEQAREGYANVAAGLPEARKLSSIYGDNLGQKDLEDEFLGGLASARRKRETLADKEAATFSGSSGLGSRTLGQRTTGRY